MKRIAKLSNLFFLLVFIAGLYACGAKKNVPKQTFKTENVFIIVIDGPRYSETWGDKTHQNMPLQAKEFSEKGVIYEQFYNAGPTYTNAGHTAITTGNYQEINNSGKEIPQFPSIFQYFLKHSEQKSESAWIITSKDKLQILADCQQEGWRGQYMPSTNCGTNGLGSDYRADSITFFHIKSIVSEHKPNLVLINFREPDYSGHDNDWEKYIQGIKDTDRYVIELWNFLQQHEQYKDKTTLFVTNDHGRHLDGHKDGFVSHGDSCEGCRHINLFAIGPDFKSGMVFSQKRNQIDIPKTVSYLLGFDAPTVKGKLMEEALK